MIDYFDPYHTVRPTPRPEHTDTTRPDTEERVPEDPVEPVDSDSRENNDEYRDEGEQIDEYA